MSSKLYGRPCDFVCVIFAAVVYNDDFAVSVVFFCAFEEAGYAACDVFFLVVGGNDEADHWIKRVFVLYVLFSGEGCGYDPYACDADGYECVPAVEEADYQVPDGVGGLLCGGVVEDGGYDPLGDVWEV